MHGGFSTFLLNEGSSTQYTNKVTHQVGGGSRASPMSATGDAKKLTEIHHRRR